MNLTNAVLFCVNAALWLYNGLQDRELFDFILASIWLTGSVIWFVRYFKERKDAKKEK